jgi:hypothetical protein|eukprot:1902854-Prymnesium_polylepis.1
MASFGQSLGQGLMNAGPWGVSRIAELGIEWVRVTSLDSSVHDVACSTDQSLFPRRAVADKAVREETVGSVTWLHS